MVDSSVRPKKTFGNKIKSHQQSIDELYGLFNSIETFAIGPSGKTIGSGSPSPTKTDLLSINGGTMIGAIAFFPKLVTIGDGEIDISPDSGNYSSRVIVTPESGATDNLVTITGAAHAGQLLFVQGVATDTLTLIDANSNQTNWVTSTAYSLGDIIDNSGTVYSCKQAHTSSATDEPGTGANWRDYWYEGNIETIDGNDFSLEDDDVIIFQFDTTDNHWQQVTSGKQGIGGSEPFATTLQQPSITTGAVTIDWAYHTHFVDVTEDITSITFSNIPSTGNSRNILIEFGNSSGSDYDITFPAAAGGETITLPDGGTAFYSLYTRDGGTTIKIDTNQGTVLAGGATVALDNLVSPALNTSIDFNSNAPTNFPGFTNAVGQALAVDGNGFTFDTPSGDSYKLRINATTIAEFTSVGLGMGASGSGAISMGENYITFDDISTPTNPGTGQRRLFVDTSTGELSVRTSAGSTVSLEGSADKISEGDSSLEVVDAGTGSIAITVDAVSQGSITNGVGWSIDNNVSINSTNTLTVGGTTTLNGDVDIGNAATDTLTITADVDSNITPANNGTQIIGSAADHWDDVFTETISFRNGTGAETSSTKMYITSDASSMIFHNPTTDDFLWQVAGATKMQWTVSGASDELYMRAGSSRVIGFIPDSGTVTLGTSGTIQMPVDGGSVGSAANADTDFGDNVGCFGIYLNTIGSGNPTFCIKIDDGTGTDNRWAAITINRTTGALSGGVLT